MTAATSTSITAEQLLRMPSDGHRYELVAGELQQMVPAGWRHGEIAGYLDRWLNPFVAQHGLGRVYIADTGFLLSRDPDTVRAPDIAFIRKERMPATPPQEAFWPGAPDLVVEVVSPGDTFREVDEKVQDWLRAGAAMVWVVNPTMRTVTVYRSPINVKTLTAQDTLSGEDVVPGFECPLREIFPDS